MPAVAFVRLLGSLRFSLATLTVPPTGKLGKDLTLFIVTHKPRRTVGMLFEQDLVRYLAKELQLDFHPFQ